MYLFEIESKINEILNNLEIDEETGEILNLEGLENLQAERETKLENIGLYILNLKSDVVALEEQEKKFKLRKEQTKKKIEQLSNLLDSSLNGQAFKTTKLVISYRKSDSLVIDDIDTIDKQYISYEPKPDKTALKQAIKAGQIIEGCHIEQKNNIQIK